MLERGQRFDDRFAVGVLDFLFINVDAAGHSSDLGARNVQRGRDHGLPTFLDLLDLALHEFRDTNIVSEIRLPDCTPGLYR